MLESFLYCSKTKRFAMIILLSLVLISFGYAIGEPARFDGHKVLRVFPNSLDEVKQVLAIHEMYNLDMWRYPRMGNYSMDVYVEPEKLDIVLALLKGLGTKVNVWIDDIQKLIDDEKTSMKRSYSIPYSLQGRNRAFFDTYHRYNNIMTFLNDIVSYASAKSTVSATLTNIGSTFEGRNIQLIKISRGDGQTRQKIFIDGGIHAREWISPATVLFFIEQLVVEDPTTEATQLLDSFDWYFVPLLNPDGYEYSHANYRLWRKNRSQSKPGNCLGTDLNRNFGFNWNPAVGGSTSACSDIYAGETAFSEKESQAIRDFINNNKNNMVAYLTYHSYGQMWLYPWGYTSTKPIDWQDLDVAAKAGTSALQTKYGTDYVVGTSTEVLYSAAGGSDDWAKGGAGIKYSYTLELRDKGSAGFVLPASQIIPNCEESWIGLVAFAKSISGS